MWALVTLILDGHINHVGRFVTSQKAASTANPISKAVLLECTLTYKGMKKANCFSPEMEKYSLWPMKTQDFSKPTSTLQWLA